MTTVKTSNSWNCYIEYGWAINKDYERNEHIKQYYAFKKLKEMRYQLRRFGTQ